MTVSLDMECGIAPPYQQSSVPGAGFEPARLSARDFKSRASTVPPPGHILKQYSTGLHRRQEAVAVANGCLPNSYFVIISP